MHSKTIEDIDRIFSAIPEYVSGTMTPAHITCEVPGVSGKLRMIQVFTGKGTLVLQVNRGVMGA